MTPAKFLYGVILVVVAALTPGCWDRREPENLAWVAAIGVDKGPQNDYLFTFQVLAPRALAGQSSGGSGSSGGGPGIVGKEQRGFEVYAVEAPDVVSALAITDGFIGRRLSLLHAKMLIIGEDVAQEGVTPVLAAATRFQEFRRTMVVAISRGSAHDLIEHVHPRLEADPAFWYELMNLWQKETSLVPVHRIHDFVINLEQPGLGASAALVGINQITPEELKQGEDPMPTDRGMPPSPGMALAGKLKRTGGDPVDFAGTAVFRGDRLAGFLTPEETRLTRALRGGFMRTPWSIEDPLDPSKRLVLMVREHRSPRKQIRRQGGRVHIDFRVFLEADIASIPSTLNYTAPNKRSLLERSVEEFVEREGRNVLRRTLNEWGADLFRIGNQLQGTFATNTEWMAFEWGQRVKEATFTVDVQFRVRRHGLTTKPAQHPPEEDER